MLPEICEPFCPGSIVSVAFESMNRFYCWFGDRLSPSSATSTTRSPAPSPSSTAILVHLVDNITSCKQQIAFCSPIGSLDP